MRAFVVWLALIAATGCETKTRGPRVISHDSPVMVESGVYKVPVPGQTWVRVAEKDRLVRIGIEAVEYHRDRPDRAAPDVMVVFRRPVEDAAVISNEDIAWIDEAVESRLSAKEPWMKRTVKSYDKAYVWTVDQVCLSDRAPAGIGDGIPHQYMALVREVRFSHLFDAATKSHLK